MREKIIAGNWKMNKTMAQSVEFFQGLNNYRSDGRKIIVCVPFTDLYVLSRLLANTKIKLGAQNMHFEEQGAYTGEISPLMLIENGVDYVIIGHSERRQYYNETNETVNLKAKAALEAGLKPIICVGETLEQRENGITESFVTSQVEKAFEEIGISSVSDTIIAYEPIWAIGTGRTASSEDANNVCRLIRGTIERLYGLEAAQNISILYGGSVNSKNVKELFEMEHIDGGLIGGASLKPDEFAKMINYEG